ncbi:sigma-54-dependent Fis family transcriptional regulator [Ottowia sp.]|uniref:sigma-54-dependent Fis family transcriptional regulator n=1 Tax=Ottowia sp. TaxID=1898956 RepID=UPI002B8FE0CA|nr:sigma-54-dependent Fis family transcriptional regulator [Ottowia sp.]HRN75020.1 sigma-54-dependent Fis family transcriptional regulator [Ottowia sp.]HRQ02124.1 sigma-54-dependent Fis family transcriptional regulator [Ottowia sp.]
MTKLPCVAPAQEDDLRTQLRFSPDTGQIWLHEHRMLLVHAEAQASLRREIIHTLGMERAKGLLLRMGYASGLRDAELARPRMQAAQDDTEAFLIGPQLHALEGIVHVTPLRLEVDRARGHFHGEFLWQNSWEGRWHRQHFGTHHEPVCWTQIGYACGYTSAFMGRKILYKEVDCVGKGDNNCRIVGKPNEEWDDAAEWERLLAPVSIAEQLIELQSEVASLRSTLDTRMLLPGEMVGSSRSFQQACKLLQAAAHGDIGVLLLGETGVGKELFARALHDMSSRRGGPFVAVNCGAIPHELVESELFGVEKGAYTGAQVSRAGRFERADGGTLFLDEIGELPLAAQAKLLRVLQEREVERLGGERTRRVDVRIVAATHNELAQCVKDGSFRSDLYYRLNAYQVLIPPLRERKEDISTLAKHFLAKYAAIQGKKLRGFTDKAKRALLSHGWPGNIRELQNIVERGVILAPPGGWVEVEHLFMPSTGPHPPEYCPSSSGALGLGTNAGAGNAEDVLCEAVFSGSMQLEQAEAMLIERAVDRSRGNLSAAARLLGLTRPQLAYRLKRLHETQQITRDEATTS